MNTTDIEDLRRLIQKYKLCWSKSPERAVVDGELRAIGWNLELCATHGETVSEPTPGCPACPPVVDALDRVARFVLPTDRRTSHYEVHNSPARIQYSNAHPRVAEMSAVITILHDKSVNDPIDACEDRCLADMMSKLRELGARERS